MVENKYFITCLAVLPGSSCCIYDPLALSRSRNWNFLPQKTYSTNNQHKEQAEEKGSFFCDICIRRQFLSWYKLSSTWICVPLGVRTRRIKFIKSISYLKLVLFFFSPFGFSWLAFSFFGWLLLCTVAKISHTCHGHFFTANSCDHSTEAAKKGDRIWNKACVHGWINAQGALCTLSGGLLSPMCLWLDSDRQSFLNTSYLHQQGQKRFADPA